MAFSLLSTAALIANFYGDLVLWPGNHRMQRLRLSRDALSPLAKFLLHCVVSVAEVTKAGNDIAEMRN